MLTFLYLYIICMVVFYGIAHLDTYFGLRKELTKEQLEDFTFYSYIKNEVERWLSNRKQGN